MVPLLLVSLIAALVFAAVHVFAGRLRNLGRIPRSGWLSTAGGVSVAYVFVHLLPELARGQEVMDGSDIWLLSYLEHHVYLLALLGLAAFYGLERLIKKHRRELPEHQESHAGVFWLHIAAFAIYNGLIGYLLVHGENNGLSTLVLYCIAMSLHFLVNDFALQNDHKDLFRRRGRWLLAMTPLAGWALGLFIEVSELAVSALTAFVGGSIILNVLKEELPEERDSRFSAFLLGAVGYSLLLLGFQAG
ncbi:hypothetical protein [Stutzerimonas stutzeri]|uniref:hypothetical protein n=1 Tax=Stutzerimonas stutzeri TaxID=316 RepID=UPI0030153777